ncbi:hypothetical protein FA13DRAFT_1741473 [Coprinellus micaceus]|uniref:Uncharacterized protein n=1 Tax=Coprinellus micaceus TaxID=71717 RepID=A0A4Y7SIX9_COPMI|nr:hypothetical protein FA13DRAFT_1741473 [Coprinellus micaceus]
MRDGTHDKLEKRRRFKGGEGEHFCRHKVSDASAICTASLLVGLGITEPIEVSWITRTHL